MSNVKNWNAQITKVIRLFFLGEKFFFAAEPDFKSITNYNEGDEVGFDIKIGADERLSTQGLILSLCRPIRFTAKPTVYRSFCKAPVEIKGPKWLLDAVYESCNDELFNVSKDTLHGVLNLEFIEDDHVYDGTLFHQMMDFEIDPLLSAGLHHVSASKARVITSCCEWYDLFFTPQHMKKCSADEYFVRFDAARLILKNACSLSKPKWQKLFTLCAMAESVQPMKRMFPEAFENRFE